MKVGSQGPSLWHLEPRYLGRKQAGVSRCICNKQYKPINDCIITTNLKSGCRTVAGENWKLCQTWLIMCQGGLSSYGLMIYMPYEEPKVGVMDAQEV